MKKIIILGALFAMAPMSVFADTSKHEPLTVVPAVKDDKDHHDQKMHDAATAKHTQKSKEEYVKEIQAKIAEIKTFLESKKGTASAEQLAQASMKVSVAEQWLKTIEGYKDPVTRYVRSVNYAMAELKSARGDTKIKTKNKPSTNADVKNGLQELTHLTETVLKEKEGIVFHEENDACFKMMLKSAYDYIELASKPESKNTFKHLTKRAHKNLMDAKKFLKAHRPHKQTHSSTKLPAHAETAAHTTTEASTTEAATTAHASAPESLGSTGSTTSSAAK
ncbi:MAG: hypothetical protein V4482_02915 [Pseudomonadota bacterium]